MWLLTPLCKNLNAIKKKKTQKTAAIPDMLRFRPCTPQWSQQGLHTYLHTMVTDSSVKIYNFVHVFLVQLFTNGRNVVQQSPILCPQKISSLIANRFARMAKKGNLQKDNRISLRTRNCSYTFSNTYCQLGLCPWSAWKYNFWRNHIFMWAIYLLE